MISLRILRNAACALATVALAACASPHSEVARKFDPAPGSTVTVTTQDRDTVATVARRYQVPETDVMALNNVYDRNAPLAGRTIRVPAYGRLREPRGEIVAAAKHEAEPAPVNREPQVALRADRITSAPLPEPRPKGKVAVDKPSEAKEQTEQRSWWSDWIAPADSVPAPVAANEKFVWPAKGPIVASFGDGAGGEHNDGINIRVPRGAPIRAAADGTVTYVGNELKGYGNLVLIRHDNGYVTAYAHADSVSVDRGQRVTKGEIIARAGSTGDVSEPQLHFEIRQGTRPVDPKHYLVAAN